VCRISKVLGVLTISKDWDPTVAFILATALVINLITFSIILRGSPVHANSFDLPSSTQVDSRVLIGAAIFGIGLGLSGLTPATGMINSFVLSNVVVWLGGMGIGSVTFDELKKRKVCDGAFAK